MNNLGIVVPHLGPSQMAYEAIRLVNSVKDAVIFFEQLVVHCAPIRCGTMCITELVNFNGLLVTTTIENTLMAHRIVNRNRTKLVFYVWDLEWLRPGKQNYMYNLQAYHAPDILVVRHEEHFLPLFNYCNRLPIVRDFQQVVEC